MVENSIPKIKKSSPIVRIKYRAADYERLKERMKKAGFSQVATYLRKCEEQQKDMENARVIKELMAKIMELWAKLQASDQQ